MDNTGIEDEEQVAGADGVDAPIAGPGEVVEQAEDTGDSGADEGDEIDHGGEIGEDSDDDGGIEVAAGEGQAEASDDLSDKTNGVSEAGAEG